MKRKMITTALIIGIGLLSGCTVSTGTGFYPTDYGPSYYPGSPYWASQTIYTGYWGNSYYWNDTPNAYRHRWYGGY